MSGEKTKDKLIALGFLAPNQVFLQCYVDGGSSMFGIVGLIVQIKNLINSISKQRYLAIGEKSLFIVDKKLDLLKEYPFTEIIEIERNGLAEKVVTLTTADGSCSFRTVARSDVFTERLKIAVKNGKDLRR